MSKKRLSAGDMELFRKNLFPDGDPLQLLIAPRKCQEPQEPLLLCAALPREEEDPGAPSGSSKTGRGFWRVHQSAGLIADLLPDQRSAMERGPDLLCSLSHQLRTQIHTRRAQARQLTDCLFTDARAYDARRDGSGAVVEERSAFLHSLQRRMVYIGCTEPPEVFCVIGTRCRDGAPVALCRQGGQVLLLCGVPGYGKSQFALCLVESHLAACPSITSAAHQPTAAMAFVTDDSAESMPELLAALLQNQQPADIERLWQELRATPQPIRRINVVVPPWQLGDWRQKLAPHLRVHPGLRVLPLRLQIAELGMSGLECALGADPESAYFQRLLEEATDLGQGINMPRWIAAIEGAKDLHAGQRTAALRALRLLGRISPVDDESIWDLVEPGALTLFVLGGKSVGKAEVLPLCAALIEALSGESPRHGPFQRLFLLDEINRMDGERRVWDKLVTLARRIRHRGGVLVILGQDFLQLPDEMMALASLGGLFHIDSPEVLSHLRAHFGGLRGLTITQARDLNVGDVVLAPRQSTDRDWQTRGYHVVRARPPLAQHGGHSRRAL